MRGGLVGLGVVVILVGGALLGFAFTREPAAVDAAPQQTAVLEKVVAQVDAEITLARDRVQAQAGKVAAMEIVRGVIVTDEVSATDALGGLELTAAGETVEVGQLVGRERAVFYRGPQGADAEAGSAARDGKPARHVDLIDDKIWLREVVEVVPRAIMDTEGRRTQPTKDGHPIKGYVMLSRPVAVVPVVQQHVTAPVAGRLELGTRTHGFGGSLDGARTVTRPLASLLDARIVLAVPAPTAAATGVTAMIAGGAGAAVLGCLVVLFALLVGKPKPAAAAGGRQVDPEAPRSPVIRPRSQPAASGLSETDLVAADSQAFARTHQSGPFGSVGTPFPVQPSAGGSAATITPGTVRPGTVIGRWELVRQIGSGGMADVYLAHARGEGGFEKQVAIKVMHPHLARNAQTVAHFLDEARLAAGIAHQNIVAIQDLGKLGDDYYIVMEYIDGLDLEKLLASARAANRAVPVHIALGILRRLCDGLNAAHQATAKDGSPLGIVHRDVKCANVLVSKQGAVKVVDFGIAKATEQLHTTVVGETKGTPSVMAPEQRAGGAVDVRADVYAVGAVGYEMLAGQPVNVDFVNLAHLGIANWPHLDPPTTVRPGLPPELDTLLFKAMAFVRDDRPADCAELEAQLDQVMKTHHLAASDKDIARWVRDELALLTVETSAPAAAPMSRSK